LVDNIQLLVDYRMNTFSCLSLSISYSLKVVGFITIRLQGERIDRHCPTSRRERSGEAAWSQGLYAVSL